MNRSPFRAAHAALLASLVAAFTACFAGRRAEPGSSTRNGWIASEFVGRPQAGGHNEGPMGFLTAGSRSRLYDELAARGIRAETVGPLNQIRDRETLLAIMASFSRSLGVRCSWCHRTDDFAAPTPRKAVAAFMWDAFVSQLQLSDGEPLYCDSCHHQSTVFLPRNVTAKPRLLSYMMSEYVNQLRRRDGREHGCATCHSNPINPRFLPRIDIAHGYEPPSAAPGRQP